LVWLDGEDDTFYTQYTSLTDAVAQQEAMLEVLKPTHVFGQL